MIDFSRLYTLRNDLHDAIRKEDLNRLNKLLVASSTTTYVNLNYVDKDGQTPLHRSCSIGNLDIVKLLISNGASLNLTNRDGWYPIHIASYLGYTHIVLYLIEQQQLQESLNQQHQRSTNIIRCNSDSESSLDSFPSSDSENDFETITSK